MKCFSSLFCSLLFMAPLLASEPVKVTLVTLEEVAFAPTYQAPAQVVPENDAVISAEVGARITKIHVEPGDTVEAGQILVTLDSREYEYQILAALSERQATEAQLDLAVVEEKRFKRLFEQKHVSDAEYLARSNDTKVLTARVQARLADENDAKLRWQRCVIKAPFSGVVTERTASVGELTQPGTALVTLVQTDRAYVLAQVNTSRAETVENAQSLELVVGSKRYPLALKTFPPVVNTTGRTRQGRFLFTADIAPPGSAGRLEWRPAQRALPAHLIVSRGKELGVMTAVGEKAVFRAIPGALEGSPAVTDLPADTKIIFEGRLGLADEDAITIQ